MMVTRRWVYVAAAIMAAGAWAQPVIGPPHVGYTYPSGGGQGSVVQVTVGGQYLRGLSDVYVSGEGMRGSVVQWAKPLNNQQLQELRKYVTAMLKTRRDAFFAANGGPRPPQDAPPPPRPDTPTEANADMTELLQHPLFRNIEQMSFRELEQFAGQRFNPAKRQQNLQLAEMAVIEITVDPSAPPGDRELRLVTPAGLTNPIRFEVGSIPELCEREPNDRDDLVLPPADLPVVLNGQIMPGDVDRFRFRALRGQQIVVEARARRLMPYLADAVPGWFQATLALYNARGREVTFADDFRFDPDPVLSYAIPEDGEYDLEIRDSIYRGREDFVYRIVVGQQPFITAMFPLGGQEGAATTASIKGWNLPTTRLRLDTQPNGDSIRQAVLNEKRAASNPVPYAVDRLPECDEKEPNDTQEKAQSIQLPLLVNGRVARPGDVDVFRFDGRAGDTVVAEVFARRLNSPIDSVLRLADASGHVLEWNDDHEDKSMGLLTHHADSYLSAKLPTDGVYYVHLADTQHQGGDAYAYRLRLAPPQPDFALRVTPSTLNVPVGRCAPIGVHVLRKDGFNGDVELVLKEAPAGFALNGARIPAGHDRIRMTLAAPRQPLDRPAAIRIEGRAQINGKTVSRPAGPAEDMMQAFAYQHLAPSQELVAAVTKTRGGGPPIYLDGDGPVRIPAGGTAQARIMAPMRPMLRNVKLELSDPPKGVTLQEVVVGPNGLDLVLKADGDSAGIGLTDNLIVEAFVDPGDLKPDGKAAKQNRRVSVGVLPAIPFVVVRQ